MRVKHQFLVDKEQMKESFVKQNKTREYEQKTITMNENDITI